MAIGTSQGPQHPLTGRGATQSMAFGGTGVTLSPQSHLFLQMHLSQGPGSCCVPRGSSLPSPLFGEESVQGLLALAHHLPEHGCSRAPHLHTELWCPHVAQLDVPHAH